MAIEQKPGPINEAQVYITILWVEGAQAGQTAQYEAQSKYVGWYYEVGSTHTVPGVGSFKVISI